MSNKNSNGSKYTSIRVSEEAARKLKALSGMNGKPIVAVVEDLVNEAFENRVKEISKNPANF